MASKVETADRVSGPLLLNKSDIVQATGLSRASVQRAITLGHLDSFLVGRRRVARPSAVNKWIDNMEQSSREGRPQVLSPRSAESKPRKVTP